MPTQAERRARTRAAVLEAATALFSERGYQDTSVADILDAAAVSRGALYHHFAAKEDVFAAVFLTSSAQAIRRAAERVPSRATPFEALRLGCLAWIDVVSEPATARILLDDGPAVLGRQRSRTLEEATSLGVLRRAISAAADVGEIEVPSVDLAARLLDALVAEAARARRAGDGTAREIDDLLSSMLGGLAVTA
jgi:AcrR family transcriptional regulator